MKTKVVSNWDKINKDINQLLFYLMFSLKMCKKIWEVKWIGGSNMLSKLADPF